MTLPPPSRRDAKKEDKRRRIRAAAAALFRERGYEGTTTRAIAERAGIATGTLFLYARDKDEALSWLYREDVMARIAERRASRPRRLRFVSGVLHLFSGLFELYADHPDLARRFLERIPALDARERPEHEALNATMLAAIEDEVRSGIARGELRDDLDVALASSTLYAVARVHVFGWLARPPVDVRAGLAGLEAVLRLLVTGFGAAG